MLHNELDESKVIDRWGGWGGKKQKGLYGNPFLKKFPFLPPHPPHFIENAIFNIIIENV
jgi:hypothetical protein